MNEIVLAADLGGTNLRMAVVNREGTILYRTKRETPRAERADEIVSAMVEAAHECSRNAGEAMAIGIAVPSGVDYANGLIIKAPNVPSLDGFRISAALSNELNLPVALENDANAAAIGEQTFGAAKGFQSAIAVTLGPRILRADTAAAVAVGIWQTLVPTGF